MRRNVLGRQQSIEKGLVLSLIERAVQIVVGSVQRFAVARRSERYRHVDRLGIDDRADAVVEKQPLRSGEPSDFSRQRIGCKRSTGDDQDVFGIERRDFFAANLDRRVFFQRARDFGGKQVPIYGQGVPRGHPRARCNLTDQQRP